MANFPKIIKKGIFWGLFNKNKGKNLNKLKALEILESLYFLIVSSFIHSVLLWYDH